MKFHDNYESLYEDALEQIFELEEKIQSLENELVDAQDELADYAK